MARSKVNVYVEVSNSVNIPFNTGIQRVVMRLLQEWAKTKDQNLHYIPILYNHYSKNWHFPDDYSKSVLYQRRRKLPNQLHRIRMIIFNLFQSIFQINKVSFEDNSIWLDLEACWNNLARRKELLPLLKEKNIESVLFVHDVFPLVEPTYFKENNAILFEQFMNSHFINTENYICNSQTTLSYLKEFFDGKSITNKLCNAVTLGADFTTADQKTKKLNARDYGKYLICVGTLEIRKNHEVLLDAYEELSKQYPDINLIIVGKEGWKIKNTKQRILNHQLFNKRIFWFKHVSDIDLKNLYQNAFLSIFPSLFEGLGLPVIESLKLRVVTICSDIKALKEAGGEYVDYFNPSDYTELYQLIKKYVDSSEKYKHKKSSLSNYTSPRWTDTADQISKLLSHIS